MQNQLQVRNVIKYLVLGMLIVLMSACARKLPPEPPIPTDSGGVEWPEQTKPCPEQTKVCQGNGSGANHTPSTTLPNEDNQFGHDCVGGIVGDQYFRFDKGALQLANDDQLRLAYHGNYLGAHSNVVAILDACGSEYSNDGARAAALNHRRLRYVVVDFLQKFRKMGNEAHRAIVEQRYWPMDTQHCQQLLEDGAPQGHGGGVLAFTYISCDKSRSEKTFNASRDCPRVIEAENSSCSAQARSD